MKKITTFSCAVPTPFMLLAFYFTEGIFIYLAIALLLLSIGRAIFLLVRKRSLDDSVIYASAGFFVLVNLASITRHYIFNFYPLFETKSYYAGYYFIAIVFLLYWLIFQRRLNKGLSNTILAIAILIFIVGIVTMIGVTTKKTPLPTTNSEGVPIDNLNQRNLPNLDGCAEPMLF